MTSPFERRKKRARYRSWHRGQKEMDVVLGRFADTHLDNFDEDMLVHYEVVLDLPDPDLFSWLIGFQAVPEDLLENPAMQLLLDDHADKSDD